MSTEERKQKTPKEVMNALRTARQPQVRAATAAAKEQRQVIRKITEQLQQGPGTVPEIAQAVGLEPDQVLWYVAALKKYGQVLEADKAGAYFRYRLAEPAPATA